MRRRFVSNVVELRSVDGINKKHVDIQCHREFKLGKTV
jgi:hypothetical protein